MMMCTFAIRLCATVDEGDTVLDKLLGALDGGLSEFVVHYYMCVWVDGRGGEKECVKKEEEEKERSGKRIKILLSR